MTPYERLGLLALIFALASFVSENQRKKLGLSIIGFGFALAELCMLYF